ncbi:SMI1/KNR4 family protein SUKH-1 [Streptomyces sp. DvalAA-21]|nr:Cell wall assembly/cell proliferation coordinating protein, KNR4-like protein [Streptomyces sp. SirexAA-E]PZX41396.1 SMI1/KNR4 family protein SUKH-1 [Streptomyces sp. DvalAA-21]RAJ37793.1 SMI1/KNR4 family protein SUKH-1 [Streptomyces sp. DpondAA-E10]RAJ51641.1 SMI1/KNR4 family protein SUKH-1 [Streptomyces sp. DpondAA-A50]SCD35092.1 SMI1 / KNR4 family (SUKH-1) [Streptomyces sp. DpondAA-F4a]SCM05564.1 SMI1 / KNR4 family (SUKH-1) [Streptomyces sp. DpondAA-F4]
MIARASDIGESSGVERARPGCQWRVRGSGTVDIDNWQSFLDRWNAQWVMAQGLTDPEEVDEEALAAGGLRFAPADEARTAALEERLGTRLPPSYRAFLQVSDGWRHAGGFVYLLGVSADVHWHGDAMGMKPLYEEQLDERSRPSEILLAGMWERALQLALDSDMTDVLLDPGDVDEDGEWAVYVYKGWSGEYPDRYASFAAFMQAMYRDFCGDHGHDPRFEDGMTRELDASVERARLACLAGEDVDTQMAVLAEAQSFGRPRAMMLRDQMAALVGPVGHLAVPQDMADPLYVHEVMPLHAVDHCRSHHDDDWFVRRHGEDGRPEAEALLAAVRERTFRYEPPGPFGRAVAEARELARWGDTDAAWQVIAAAVPDWEPYGPEHLAPIGLKADPLLGPLLTPERGRRILTTPRAGHGVPRGAASEPPHPAGPQGLGWPTGEDHRSWRFVAVQGITPRTLAERLGGADLLAPHSEEEMWRLRHRSGGGCAYQVGSCGGEGDWSFALEWDPESYQPGRVTGVDAAVSRGTRSVSVWSERHHSPGPAFADVFRVAYAEDGEGRFTAVARGGVAESTGTPPEGLDPDLFGTALFGGAAPAREEDEEGPALLSEAEARALDALAGAFGIGLPWFALRHGRLHAVRGASWIRPPGPGEAVLAFARIRPSG